MRCSIATALSSAGVVPGGARKELLSRGSAPNELWCTDYKGEFLLGNRQYCYPLTVTDHASRFLLSCEALSSTRENYAFAAFERLFKERGLPANIRSDNGVPFAFRARSVQPKQARRLVVAPLALASSASNLAIPSKTAVTNACISL
jgi:transposase InsO family protein